MLRSKSLRGIFFVLTMSLAAAPVLFSQAAPGTPSPNVSVPGSQQPFLGSEPEGKASGTVLQIDLRDAIDRGLRNNLGLLLAGDQTVQANGERWKELSNLLPNLSAGIIEDVQTTSLKASRFSYKDAREFVVLAVGNAYLLSIASAARVETAQAQVKNAQALYDKADDQRKAGLSPAIDKLRAQVELQTRQQQLIAASNDLAKQKLSLARIIGLPPGQEFLLTESAPYQELTPLPLETYLQHAYASRPDYQAALAQVRAAELSRRSATAGHYPSLDMNANLGDIGVTPAHSNGTWQVQGGVTIPIFAGGKTHSDVLEAESQLRQARSQLGDLGGRIDYEVRTALLDLHSAAEQVEVARSSVDLAEQTLAQSQDRFTAGVADNLEVVQAQESVATAHENYIQSLYGHNLAKIELARAIGDAEEGVKRYLKGN